MIGMIGMPTPLPGTADTQQLSQLQSSIMQIDPNGALDQRRLAFYLTQSTALSLLHHNVVCDIMKWNVLYYTIPYHTALHHVAI